MTRKKLLFVLPDFGGGGAQRVFSLLLQQMDRERFEPHLLILCGMAPLPRTLPKDVSVTSLNARRVLKALPGIIRTVRRLKPELVVATIGYVNLVVLAASLFFPRRTRVIVREANMPSSSLRMEKRPAMFRRLYRFLYPRAAGIICPSQVVKNDLIATLSFVPKVPVAVLPNPVAVAQVEDSIIQRRTFVSSKSGALHLVAAGRLSVQKGFDILIAAVPLLKELYPRITLSILGAGTEELCLRRRVAENGLESHVAFLGFIPDPMPYYAAADFFVLSSRWEGMPNAALEALACGTPVVAFAHAGGIGEVVRDGANGVLVEEETSEALAAAIVKAHELYSGRAREAFLPERFFATNAAREYETFFEKTSA